MTQPRTSESLEAQGVSERRRHARIPQRNLESSLGKVIDLSRSGMRVQGTRRLRGALDVVIYNNDGPHIKIRARVAWTKRIGFFKHMSGLEFIDLPSSVASELARIATAE